MPKRNEILKFTTSFLGTTRASAQTTIVDTSYTSTYSAKWSSNALGTDTISETDEGKDVYLIITTDNVSNGTIVKALVNATGLGVDGATTGDFTNYVQTQDVTINNNFASVKVSISADKLTENRESFYAAVLNTSGTVLSTATLYINDTSKTPEPTYEVGWYSTSTGTTPINTINEGSTAWLIVKTTNVNDNMGLGVKFSGSGIVSADVSGSITDGLESAINIVNNIGRLAVTFTADKTTEGNEVLNTQITSFGVNVGSTNITIIDTSTSYIVTATATAVDSGYYVVRGFNLADEFYKLNARYPGTGDVIIMNIPSNWAFVGSDSSKAGITIDNRCDSVDSITINNNGLILGLGGSGGRNYGSGMGPLTPGDTGIRNYSVIPVTVINTGVVAGGGGAGGTGRAGGTGSLSQNPVICGGGGAPYGYGGVNSTNVPNINGLNATLLAPGKGGYSTKYPSEFGGTGGTWGAAGLVGSRSSTGNSEGGFIKEGNVIIIGGTTLGR